jgi:predicted metal-binding protein
VKENSIEETKKQLELILKVRKEQKEIIECSGGSCMNCNPDIKALTESIEILSDYKRALKENEE